MKHHHPPGTHGAWRHRPRIPAWSRSFCEDPKLAKSLERNLFSPLERECNFFEKVFDEFLCIPRKSEAGCGLERGGQVDASNRMHAVPIAFTFPRN
jgi:hypothetical protein